MSGLAAPLPAAGNRALRRRLLRNLAWVGWSQAVVAGLGLGALALTAHALGPAGLGVLAVIESWARLLARLLHPEPWQALIQHGTGALDAGDTPRFQRLVFASLAADVLLGLLTAAVGVGLGYGLAAQGWGGLTPQQAPLLALAAAASGLALRPTATGVLRIFDRFDRLARIDVLIALLRLALVALAWATGQGLVAFVLLFAAWTALDGLLPMLAAWGELRRRQLRPEAARLRRVRAENPGVLRLFFTSNLSVTMRQLRQRLDVLVLAALLPPAALGLYQIGRRAADASLRVGRPLGQIVLPEFARLAARGDLRGLRRGQLAGSAAMMAVLLVLLAPLLLTLRPLLGRVLGPDFAPATTSVGIMLVAAAMQMTGLTLAPALISLRRDAALAWITGLSTLLFFALLLPAARFAGIEGAAAVHAVANGIALTAALWVGMRATRSGAAAAGQP